MKPERWASNGREPWIFRATDPQELCGRHADLIASALDPRDRVHYLLYSPIFDARCGLFGIHGAPASHAVALTQDRFVISSDPHANARPATVESVPLEKILAVELGSALVLGWLAIRFAADNTLRSVVVLFGTSGTHHFEALVRAQRRLAAPWVAMGAESVPRAELWRSTLPYLGAAVEPLLLDDEQIVCALHWHEAWRSVRSRWTTTQACTSTPGLLLASRLGVLWVASEPRVRPNVLSFGVNATSIRWSALRGASVEQGAGDHSTPRLRLALESHGVSLGLDIQLDDQGARAASHAIEWLGRRDDRRAG